MMVSHKTAKTSSLSTTWKISDVAKTPWAPELDNSIIAANFGNVAE
jgi:hypothetical protein